MKIKSKFNSHVFIISDCFESLSKAAAWGDAVVGGCSGLFYEVEEQ